MRSDLWTDEELIVACYIYNSEWSYTEKVRKGLIYLSRNESSIKKRFANFDFYKHGSGLANGGVHAQSIWNEYAENDNAMAVLAEKMIQNGIVGKRSNTDSEMAMMIGSTDLSDSSYHEYAAKFESNQNELREKALTCANYKCSVTGISDKSILVASHIKPWSVCTPVEMTDIHNSLCLNIFHCELFDKYRMTVNESMEIVYDPELERSIPEGLYRSMVEEYTEIKVNDKNRPGTEYLEYHNNRFRAVTGLKV